MKFRVYFESSFTHLLETNVTVSWLVLASFGVGLVGMERKIQEMEYSHGCYEELMDVQNCSIVNYSLLLPILIRNLHSETESTVVNKVFCWLLDTLSKVCQEDSCLQEE
jgi:hypothetical protein